MGVNITYEEYAFNCQVSKDRCSDTFFRYKGVKEFFSKGNNSDGLDLLEEVVEVAGVYINIILQQDSLTKKLIPSHDPLMDKLDKKRGMYHSRLYSLVEKVYKNLDSQSGENTIDFVCNGYKSLKTCDRRRLLSDWAGHLVLGRYFNSSDLA